MKTQFISLLFCFVLLQNCDVLDELTKFDMDYETSYRLDPVPIVGVPVSLFTPDIETESETTFENNNTNADLVESVTLKSLTLNIVSPDTGNFNFLKSVRIAISSDNNDEVEAAYLLDIPNDNLKTLELEVINNELAAYLKEDTFKLRVTAVTDETTTELYDVDFFATFSVDAKILGI